MHTDDPFKITETPYYRKWWFITVVSLGLIYATSAATVILLEETFEAGGNSPITIMYKWTDENGVTHYSDVKPEVPAKEIPFVADAPSAGTVDFIKKYLFIVSYTVRPILGILFVAFLGTIAIIKGTAAARYYTQRKKEKRSELRGQRPRT